MKQAVEHFLARAVLALRVNSEAFWLAPAGYLTALKWWLLRKRVRARGQFAPLLGRSPKAYMLWSLRDARNPSANTPPGQTPPIVALVADSTPDYLEFGDYRGWVELDEQGAYCRDLTDAQVRAADVAWDPTSGDYARTGTVRATLTAELTAINEEFGAEWLDTITIRNAQGEEVDIVRVPSSEEPVDYDEALWAAGYGGVTIVNGAA
jgi:hypothetical protein